MRYIQRLALLLYNNIVDKLLWSLNAHRLLLALGKHDVYRARGINLGEIAHIACNGDTLAASL